MSSLSRVLFLLCSLYFGQTDGLRTDGSRLFRSQVARFESQGQKPCESLIRLYYVAPIGAFFSGTFKQGVSKQGVMTFTWRLGSQYDVTATRGANSVLASDCRAQFGRPSTRKGCRICVTVQPVPPRGETMYWQANTNTPLSVTPPLKCAQFLYQRNGH